MATKDLTYYLETLEAMLEARESNDEETEDRLLDELDAIWSKLPEDGVNLVGIVSRIINKTTQR